MSDLFFLRDYEGSYTAVKDQDLLLGVSEDRRPLPGVGIPIGSTQSGNKFHSQATGKFGFKPGNSTIRSGGYLLRQLPIATRDLINKRAASLKADSVAAYVIGGKLKVAFLKGGKQIDVLELEDSVNPRKPINSGPPEEVAKRSDTAREMAREFEDFDEGDVREFLKGRTLRDLTDDEIEQFHDLVRDHRINDMVDILDQRMIRAKASRSRNRRFVSVNAPKGFMRKSLNGLTDEEVRLIAIRLSSKGWTENDLNQFLIKRFTDKRQPRLAGLIGIDLA